VSLPDPFVVDSSLRDDFLKEAAVANDDDDRLDYFWVAFQQRGDPVTQYNTDGTETSYSRVRELKDNGELTGLFWVPIDEQTPGSFGVDGIDAAAMGVRRRGAIVKNAATGAERQRFVYAVRAWHKTSDATYLYVSPSGDTKVSDDWEFNYVSYFGLTE